MAPNRSTGIAEYFQTLTLKWNSNLELIFKITESSHAPLIQFPSAVTSCRITVQHHIEGIGLRAGKIHKGSIFRRIVYVIPALFLKLNLLRWHWLIRLYTFPVYNSMTHHLRIELCAHHPNSLLVELLAQTPWKTVWSLLKKLRIELPHDPADPPLGIYSKFLKTLICKVCALLCSLQLYSQWPTCGDSQSVLQ